MSRITRPGALLALLALLPAAACKDQSPTLTGDPSFPGGSRPATLEAIIPASQFLTAVGMFTGYERASSFSAQVVANQFGGALSAHPLQRYIIPRSVDYSINGTATS